MSIYMVCDENGDQVCDGLQEHNAERIAQNWANRLGAPVWLYERGDDDGEKFSPEFDADDFVLVRSDAGDGGWSLYAPNATDEQIASGDEPPLSSGEAELEDGEWDRPNAEDYDIARVRYAHRIERRQ
jgi:hypothetical protein